MRILGLLLLLCAGPTLADLYRWVDPQTGSVKFSSYPPPWYGDPVREKRSPKVQHIPAGRAAPPTAATPGLEERPAPPAGDRGVIAEMEARRKALLAQIGAALAKGGPETESDAFKRQALEFTSLQERLDKLDPAGAAARLEEVKRIAQQPVAREPAK